MPILSHLGVMVTKIGDRSSFLTVPAVNGDNSGKYTCTASNSAGTYNHSTMLNVNGLLDVIALS